jgi:hypothetical protein
MNAAVSLQHGLVLPALIMVPALVLAAVSPVAFASVLILVALLVFGLRHPIATAALVLIAIPVIDQAIADDQFTELFGAFRVTPAVVLKGMMTLVIVSYLMRSRINPLRYRLLRPLLIWLAYTMCTCLLFHDRALAFSMWMRLGYWSLYFVFFFVVAAQEPAITERGATSKVIWLWRAGLAAVAIFVASVVLAKMMGIGGNYYGVGESYGFYADPWNMAMTLPGGLVLALLYPWVSGDERRWVTSGCYALTAATVLASFLTFTRTSLIACLFAGLLFGFMLRRLVVSRQTRLVFALALVVVAGALLFVYLGMTSSKAGNQMSARWSEVDKGDIGSGRLEVFYAAWTKFANASPVRKLVGHGIGAGPEAAEEFMGVYVYLHDDLLEMLVCAGLIGLGLYCWFFARMYREVLNGFRTKTIWALAALCALAVYNLTSISYMRIYAVTPNTYFALVAGTSLGMLQAINARNSKNDNKRSLDNCK